MRARRSRPSSSSRPSPLAVWGAGRLLHSRSKVSAALSARTAELREARDRRAELEITADRARVSGELDELLHRRLGELAAMAEAGGATSDPVAAEAALHEIENESRRTLDQMRTVVGVLRDGPETDGREPQPTLTHLEALLLRARGGDARLIVEGNPRVLPAGVELAAYRIVEHLLDTLEDVPVDVTVRFGDDALELAVAGPARRRNAAAIKRAQERVQLHRGTLRSTTTQRRPGRVGRLAPDARRRVIRAGRRSDLLVGGAGVVAALALALLWGRGGFDVLSSLLVGARARDLAALPAPDLARRRRAGARRRHRRRRVRRRRRDDRDDPARRARLLRRALGSHWRGLGGPIALSVAGEIVAWDQGTSRGVFAFFIIMAWLAGRAVREHEQLAASLAIRNAELAEEQEAHAELSVRYERARIAGELHDLVAHAISVMVIQAGAGQRLAARDPERTREAFRAIADAAREAESDLARLVALLSDRELATASPDLALVQELVERAAASGLDVRLRLEGDTDGLPGPLLALAHRVVQEGVTNALRYGSGAPVHVWCGAMRRHSRSRSRTAPRRPSTRSRGRAPATACAVCASARVARRDDPRGSRGGGRLAAVGARPPLGSLWSDLSRREREWEL